MFDFARSKLLAEITSESKDDGIQDNLIAGLFVGCVLREH
jgi:hypothetical protein